MNFLCIFKIDFSTICLCIDCDSENKTKGDLSRKFGAISPIEARILFEGHNLPDYWFPQIRFPISELTQSAPIHQLSQLN